MSSTSVSSTTVSAEKDELIGWAKSYKICGGGVEIRKQKLLRCLQTSDCRDIVAAAEDKSILSNAFIKAGSRHDVDLLKAFLDNEMNVDIKNQCGYTALIGASGNEYEDEQCFRLLLDHNASVDVQDNDGWTALMFASCCDSVNKMEMLLERNADINIQSQRGETALMFACQYNKKEMVQLLLNNGADIDLKNNDSKTALDLAKQEEIKEMIRNHVNSSYVLK